MIQENPHRLTPAHDSDVLKTPNTDVDTATNPPPHAPHTHLDATPLVHAPYSQAIRNQAHNNTIILIFTDLAALDLALNFHTTSLLRHNISNYLFVTTSKVACAMLFQENLPCSHYMNDTHANASSKYGSREFNWKMNVRTFMILDALKLGYNVLHTDADMIFFTDPQPDIALHCKGQCDLISLQDGQSHNAGFLFIRSTQRSIAVYEAMDKLAKTTTLDDQSALNKAVGEKKPNLNAQHLPISSYVCGNRYYEDGKRTFAGDNPCSKCIVVHNNWIVTIEAKIYRAREMHHWFLDGPSLYYTNTSRKYLTYSNPLWFRNVSSTWEHEKAALINALALGEILNRVVVLPRFICPSGRSTSCVLLHHIYLEAFDEVFGGRYRESTFLSHPLVPASVTASTIMWSHPTAGMNVSNGSVDEVRSWFSDVTESVLVLPSLYGNVAVFSSDVERRQFGRKCETAFEPCSYRQFRINSRTR